MPVDLDRHVTRTYALLLKDMDPAKAAQQAAMVAGRHAKRLGLNKRDAQRWLQKAYGGVFVRSAGLRPPYDLKDIWKFMSKSMGEDTMSRLDSLLEGLKDIGEAERPKKPDTSRTYAKAKNEILDALDNDGWKMSNRSLKVPHATSPSKRLRLWFKTQSVYVSGGVPPYTLGNASSMHIDVRKVDPQVFVNWVNRNAHKL
jgi:hypothetical protein